MSEIKLPFDHSEERTFFASIGWAISRWSHLEWNLAHLYGRILRKQSWGQSDGAAESVFGAIQGFKNRVDVVDIVASRNLLEDDRKHWLKIRKMASDASAIRNRIVHEEIICIGSHDEGGFRYALQVPKLMKSEGHSNAEAKHLLLWAKLFDDCSAEINSLNPERFQGQL